MNKYLIIFVGLILCGCHTIKSNNNYNLNKEDWIFVYKNSVFISCLKSSISSNGCVETYFKDDASEAINFDVIGDINIAAQTDSIGKQYYNRIKPSIVLDFNNKKAVVNECLAFYISSHLDSIAEREYKKYLKR